MAFGEPELTLSVSERRANRDDGEALEFESARSVSDPFAAHGEVLRVVIGSGEVLLKISLRIDEAELGFRREHFDRVTDSGGDSVARLRQGDGLIPVGSGHEEKKDALPRWPAACLCAMRGAFLAHERSNCRSRALQRRHTSVADETHIAAGSRS